jgi:hypothetical protein
VGGPEGIGLMSVERQIGVWRLGYIRLAFDVATFVLVRLVGSCIGRGDSEPIVFGWDFVLS